MLKRAGYGVVRALEPNRRMVPSLRATTLLNSRNHTTELATAVQSSQSSTPKLTVENASWRKGV